MTSPARSCAFRRPDGDEPAEALRSVPGAAAAFAAAMQSPFTSARHFGPVCHARSAASAFGRSVDQAARSVAVGAASALPTESVSSPSALAYQRSVVKLTAGEPTELRGSSGGGGPATASMRATFAPGFL